MLINQLQQEGIDDVSIPMIHEKGNCQQNHGNKQHQEHITAITLQVTFT